MQRLGIAVSPDWRGRASATPAARLGSHYSLVGVDAATRLPGGPLRLLAVLASLERPRGHLTLSPAELAASAGASERSVRRWIPELEAKGFTEGGRLVEAHRPAAVAKRHHARVEWRRLPWLSLPSASFRAAVMVAAFTDRRGRLTVPRRRVAEVLEVSARALRKCLARAVALGWRIARKAARRTKGSGCHGQKVPGADSLRILVRKGVMKVGSSPGGEQRESPRDRQRRRFAAYRAGLTSPS